MYIYFDAAFKNGEARLGVIVTEHKIKHNKVSGPVVTYTESTTATSSFDAEFKAFLFAARIANELHGEFVTYYSDNQSLVLLLNQVLTFTKMLKNSAIRSLAHGLYQLLPTKKRIHINWIPRSNNHLADRLTHETA